MSKERDKHLLKAFEYDQETIVALRKVRKQYWRGQRNESDLDLNHLRFGKFLRTRKIISEDLSTNPKNPLTGQEMQQN